MKLKVIRYVILALLISMFVVGFGIGQANAQATQDVKISLKEFSLTPNKVTVPRGQAVKFTVTNAGTVEHNFDVELESQTIEKTLFAPNLKPGETKTAEFTFTAAGEWQMYCPLDQHKDKGMLGTLIVVADQPSTLPRTGATPGDAALWLLGALGVLAVGLSLWFRTANTRART